jgi:MFS family permease
MRKNIVLMNILVAFFWMSMYSYVPNLPEYAQTLGADAVVLGIIGGVYGIAQIVLRIPIGIISDKTGKNRLMLVVGSAVLAASCGILMLADNTGLIIFGRLIAGAAAAWWVIQSATYAHYHRDEKQVKAQGILSASANWGKLAAALIGGLAAQFLGLRSIFVFSFFIAVASLFLVIGIKDIPKKEHEAGVNAKNTRGQVLQDLLLLFRNRDLMLFSLLAILSNILCFAAPILFTAVAAKDLGASSLELGMLNLMFYLMAGLTSLFVGTGVYRKMGGINALSIAFLITAVSCVPLFYHANLASLYLMQALSGVGFGVTGSAVAGMVIRAVRPDQRATATGIFQSLFGIGIFIGPVMVGSITKALSFDAAYWTLVAVGVVSAVLCYGLIPKKYDKM